MDRNSLARDRTVLANRRTLLAYVRTAFMLFATGITFLKLFPDDLTLFITGWVFIPVSWVVLFIGIYSYYRFKKKINP